MSSLVQDLRYAVRSFSQRIGFTAVVVLTLAIGIGSNVAIFSVANAVVFRPLPYDDPQRLVLVWNRSSTAEAGRSLVSGPDYLDYRDQTTMFEDFAGASAVNGTMTGDGPAEQYLMGWVTENFFEVLGVPPLLGHDFTAEDATPIDPQKIMDPNTEVPPGVMILSHGLWHSRFGGDPQVLGRTVMMDGQPNIVIGVLPRDFRIYLPADAGMPTNVDAWRVIPVALWTNPRDAEWLTVVARLKEGVALEQAQAEMDALAARLMEQHQSHAQAGLKIELNTMHRDVIRHVRPILLALVGAGGFVLLIACSNVANLLLARAATREPEIALRAALGGGQGRIIRQMLIESGVLSVAGGLAGLFLAWGGIRIVLAMRPENLPRLDRISIDGTVLWFALGATLLSALIFGIVPALKSSRPNLVNALKERGDEMGGIRGNKLRTGLVVLEVALSLVLLIGAGLLMRSFAALQEVEPGFQTENVLTFSVPLPAFGYRESSRRNDFFLRLREGIRALPGVEAAGSVVPLPLGGADQYFVFSYGRTDVTDEEWNRNKADYRWMTPGYHEAMGIRLVAGRFMTEADNRPDASEVIWIDELLAKRLWPNDDPVDKLMLVERFNLKNFTMERFTVQVAGVVGHVRAESLSTEGREALYFPHRLFPFISQTMAVRTAASPLGLVKAIQSLVKEVDPNVPVADLRLMEEYVSKAMAQTRFTLTLISLFAALALILATIGLYGVISYSVQQRTREIGVRMAFGAQGGNILRLVVGQGLILVLSGVAIGVLAAFLLTRMVSSLFFGVTATDPVTFVGISVLLTGVALAASYLPARRAMRVDPLEALRGDFFLSTSADS